MPLKKFLLIVVFLAACAAHENGWTPTVDTANDPHSDTLQIDLGQCHALAEQAAAKALTAKTKNRLVTDDDVTVNAGVFRRDYIKCMKERKHPVVD